MSDDKHTRSILGHIRKTAWRIKNASPCDWARVVRLADRIIEKADTVLKVGADKEKP